jgi:hypothetical protein
MKKLLIATAVTACISAQTYAENMAFESNPLGLALGIFNGTFLFDVSDNLSIGPSVTYWGFDLSDDEFTLFGASARAEYMPSGNKMSGLYVAGAANYSSFSLSSNDGSVTCEAKVTGLGATATGGYKYISSGGFIAKVGAGYSLGSLGNFEGTCSDDTTYDDSADVPFGGLAFEWTLGYKF